MLTGMHAYVATYSHSYHDHLHSTLPRTLPTNQYCCWCGNGTAREHLFQLLCSEEIVVHGRHERLLSHDRSKVTQVVKLAIGWCIVSEPVTGSAR